MVTETELHAAAAFTDNVDRLNRCLCVMIWSFLCLVSCLILKSLSLVSSVSLHFLPCDWLSCSWLFPPVWISIPALFFYTCVSFPSVFSRSLLLVRCRIVFVSSRCQTVVLLGFIKKLFFGLNLILWAALGSTFCSHHSIVSVHKQPVTSSLLSVLIGPDHILWAQLIIINYPSKTGNLYY